MRSWHIWDFPDTIYLSLSDIIREEFFRQMFNKVGGKRAYARFLGISPKTVKQYARGYTYKNGIKYPQAIPISLFKKSLHLINNELKEKIKKNICLIKSKNKGISIVNPNLPFIESPAFYRIIAHMIGDSCASKNKVPYYANKCKELREQFKEDLRIFGEVRIYERETKTVSIVCFPKVITDILSYILVVSFTNPDKIPRTIFQASNKCKSAFLRVLFDDEGYSSNGIIIRMKSHNLIKEIKRLMEQCGIMINKIFTQKDGKITSISINHRYIEKFRDRIGFSHPQKIKI